MNNGGTKLKSFKPPQVTAALQSVAGKDHVAFLERGGWCLLTAYRCATGSRAECQEEVRLEKEIADLQSRMAMLQCPTFVLADEVHTYHHGARKAAMQVFKCKYLKRRRKRKVNTRKVHLALATFGPGWDPDAW